MNDQTAPTECIYCGSTNLSAGEFEEVDNVQASRKVVCLRCHRWWWEIYVFAYAEHPNGSRVKNV